VSGSADLVDQVRRVCTGPGSRADRARRVADVVRRGTGFRWVGVYAVARGTVVLQAWSGPAPPAYPEFPADQGLTGAAIAAGDVVVSNDVGTDPRYLTNSATTGSELIAPVRTGGEVIGTLDVESERTGAFADAHADLARRLAATLALLWSEPETRQDEVDDRSDEDGVGDGADPDAAAEQPAAGQHAELDAGPDDPHGMPA
jgi:putative methionine-R-sulfoxide reductase with GAF domain